ncbi:TolC family protein [Arundinibacter roseus]|nr:TolC family protein [Arundinibacter roseus]
MKLSYLFVLILSSFSAIAQDSLLFTYRDFYEQLLANHPVIKQSELIPESARQDLMMARGGFDPKLEGTFNRKVYQSKEYFNRSDFFLKVPVWVGGADLKLGYDRNVGETLSDDIRTGPEGITYLGLTVPIGQGFLIDSRRATLRQAQVFQEIADAERVGMINKIILSSAKDYWNWYFAYQQYQLATEFYTLAQIRYEALSQRVNLGEAAVIDTVEALVTLQDREVALSQATLDVRNARLLLSNHLWSREQVPLELPENAIPQPAMGLVLGPERLNDLLRLARESHPDILKLNFKQQQLQIDERLGREMLKPVVNLETAALYKGITLNGQETQTGFSSFNNNYKLIIDVYFPLFLRKERGKLQQIRIKQLQNTLEQQQLQREISNEINAAFNDVKTLENQIRIQTASIQNQELLLKAEVQKFELGESSLFLVNARESKLNELKIKVESLRSKYEKALSTLLFAAGLGSWNNE